MSYTEVKQFPNGDVAIRLHESLGFEDPTHRWLVIIQKDTGDATKSNPTLDTVLLSDEQVAEATTMITLVGDGRRR